MHPTLIEPLTVGTHVLAVGSWGTFADGRVPQLRLFAQESWQIAYWHTDEDTGSATQPVSPPALTAHQRATERTARGPLKRTPRSTGARRRPAAPTRCIPPHPVPPPAEAPDVPQRRPHPPVPPAPSTDAPRTPPPAPVAPSAGSPAEQPAVPPRPSHPPLPASPPPLPKSRRLRGLSG